MYFACTSIAHESRFHALYMYACVTHESVRLWYSLNSIYHSFDAIQLCFSSISLNRWSSCNSFILFAKALKLNNSSWRFYRFVIKIESPVISEYQRFTGQFFFLMKYLQFYKIHKQRVTYYKLFPILCILVLLIWANFNQRVILSFVTFHKIIFTVI